MNINNVNGSIGPEMPVHRNKDAANVNPERTAEPRETEETPREAPAVERTEKSSSDTFNISRESSLVEELTNTVENMEETTREEVVSRASKRVQNGYYNNDDTMGNIALSLLNTGLNED